MNYLWLTLSWVIYFAIHSISATAAVKKVFYRIGMAPSTYRLLYNLFSVLLLLPILYITLTISPKFIFTGGKFTQFVGLVFATWGLIIVKLAFKSYNTREFLGFAPPSQEPQLKTDGLLRQIRHPLYSGSMLVLIGYFFFHPTYNTLLSVSMMIIYFVVGSLFEERKLIQEFGEDYIKYRKSTPMFIPHLGKRQKKSPEN